MKTVGWGLLILSLMCGPAAWGEEQKTAPQEPAATEETKQKENYEKRAQEALNELGKKIEAMKDQAAAAGAEAKELLSKQYKELTDKEGATRKKLEDLKAAGAEAWEKLKVEIEEGIGYLQKTFQGEPEPIKK